jgi:hypothetical protein
MVGFGKIFSPWRFNLFPLLARLWAAGAASIILTVVATIPHAANAQTQPNRDRPVIEQRAAPAQPNRPIIEQRAAPVQPNRPVIEQRAAPHVAPAPVFGTAPGQHTAPPVVIPPSTPPPYINTGRPVPVTPLQDSYNPNVQLSNPGAVRPNLPLNALRPNPQINNPNALRPNLPLNNPSALAPTPPLNDPTTLRQNVPGNNASVLRVNPSPMQQGNAISLHGANTLRSGPGQPPATPALPNPGAGNAQQVRPAFSAVNLHNKFWPIIKGSKFIWVGGHRKFFVPVGLLGVVLIGGSYWYPDGYVSMEGPTCTGYTPNGCQLQWRMVGFEDGGSEPQCVQYCPQVEPPPPEQVATLPPPPPPLPENGACQVTIYSEPNFTGTSAPTDTSQPELSPTGWRNEISSLVVGAGIWDFFTEENFSGESMRLPPGTYPTLSAGWTRMIGSFMCVQPGPPGA